MEIKDLVEKVSGVLLPALPYLVLVGKKASEKMGSEIGAALWNNARKIWDILYPGIRKKPGALESFQEAAREMKRNEERGLRKDTVGTLQFWIRKVLEEDQSLISALEKVITSMPPNQPNSSNVVNNPTIGPGAAVAVGPNATAVTIHEGDVTYGRTLEIKDVYLDLKLEDGQYPTLLWVETSGGNEMVTNMHWKPKWYSYEKMKNRLIKAINEWVGRGWELVEQDIDKLWIYKDERAETLPSLIILGELGEVAWKHRRIYYGAQFHVRRIE